MPEPPEGEAELRELALKFVRTEGYALGTLGMVASDSDRSRDLGRVLERIAELRRLDLKGPVIAAYLHEHPKGHRGAVGDLAGSLALRLDRGAQRAAESARDAFRLVSPGNVAQLAKEPLTAAIDTAGKRWSLGHWADMNTTTIGRQATSRGVADNVGEGGKVTIEVGQCGYCREHAGEAVIGEDPLPPYHPSCSCVASAT